LEDYGIAGSLVGKLLHYEGESEEQHLNVIIKSIEGEKSIVLVVKDKSFENEINFVKK
jgi:hypothetical protein